MAMASVIAMRGNPEECTIDWSRCDVRKFKDALLFSEAYSNSNIRTLKDLIEYIDDTDILAYLDSIRLTAFHEVNHCILPATARPQIYYEVLGRYYMLEFQPNEQTLIYGRLPLSANLISTWSEFEDNIPEFTTWEYTPIKSM